MDLEIASIAGFACGSIPFALLIAKLFGLEDPRTYGSKNPGATNVMRSGNKLAGRLVFVADILKGLLPALLATYLSGSADVGAAAGAAAVAGHVWSPWLGFQGGRGVATGFGAVFAIDWRCGLIAVGVWLALYLSTKVVSLASTTAFVVVAVVAYWVIDAQGFVGVALPAIAMIIVLRHRQNIQDLLAGKERNFKSDAQKK